MDDKNTSVQGRSLLSTVSPSTASPPPSVPADTLEATLQKAVESLLDDQSLGSSLSTFLPRGAAPQDAAPTRDHDPDHDPYHEPAPYPDSDLSLQMIDSATFTVCGSPSPARSPAPSPAPSTAPSSASSSYVAVGPAPGSSSSSQPAPQSEGG